MNPRHQDLLRRGHGGRDSRGEPSDRRPQAGRPGRLPGADFARSRGVSPSSLSWWRWRLRGPSRRLRGSASRYRGRLSLASRLPCARRRPPRSTRRVSPGFVGLHGLRRGLEDLPHGGARRDHRAHRRGVDQLEPGERRVGHGQLHDARRAPAPCPDPRELPQDVGGRALGHLGGAGWIPRPLGLPVGAEEHQPATRSPAALRDIGARAAVLATDRGLADGRAEGGDELLRPLHLLDQPLATLVRGVVLEALDDAAIPRHLGPEVIGGRRRPRPPSPPPARPG